MTGFVQPPPQLGNQFTGDPLLLQLLARLLPSEVRAAITPTLHELGELAGGGFYQRSLAERLLVPVHTPWDAWGNRIDHIDVTPLWHDAARLLPGVTTGEIPLGKRIEALTRARDLLNDLIAEAQT